MLILASEYNDVYNLNFILFFVLIFLLGCALTIRKIFINKYRNNLDNDQIKDVVINDEDILKKKNK